MIDASQLRSLIADICNSLGHGGQVAVDLLMGTCAQESFLGTFIEQIGSGPALGIMQMEPTTEQDIWDNYLQYRPELKAKLYEVCGRLGPGPWLRYDLAYQIAMARIHYVRVPEALPELGDIYGLARYWKHHYNTALGAGTEEEFIGNYHFTEA